MTSGKTKKKRISTLSPKTRDHDASNTTMAKITERNACLHVGTTITTESNRPHKQTDGKRGIRVFAQLFDLCLLLRLLFFSRLSFLDFFEDFLDFSLR